MEPLADLAAAAHRRVSPAGVVLARRRDGETEVATAGSVEADAVFELGSVTKAVTGLLLADAVVRGEAALETPLAECLPGVTADGLALGDLASHTAGLPRVPLALLRRVGFRNTTDPYAATTVEELVADLTTVRRRGARYRYSNFGAALLGQALAARAGSSYEKLVTERILRPLDLEDELSVGGERLPVQPHDRRGRPVPPWRLGAYAPAGALRGTVGGALGFAAACLDPPESLRDAASLALTPRARRGPLACGLGWHRSPVAGGVVAWWHNGATNGSRAFTGFDPEHRVAVAAATNAPRAPDSAAQRALAG